MVFDVGNPTNPLQIGELQSVSGFAMQFVGNLAYFAGGYLGVQVVDVSDPANPLSIGGSNAFDPHVNFISARVSGDYVFAMDQQTGLRVFRVDFRYDNTLNYAPPAEIAFTNGSLTLPATSDRGLPIKYSVLYGTATIAGNRLTFTGPGGVQLRADCSDDPLYLPFSAEWAIRIFQYPQTLTWQANTNRVLTLNTPHPLGAATASSGLPVTFRVDAGPATISNGIITVNAPGTVVVTAEQAGNATYEAVRETRTYNVRQAILTPLGAGTGGFAWGVKVAGNLAYVAGDTNGLEIFDLSDPAHPNRIGQVGTTAPARRVKLAGGLAYVATQQGGFQVMDVTDPVHPFPVSGFDTAGTANSVQAAGRYAYVADGEAGLQVVDLADPAHPVAVGSDNFCPGAFDVQVAGATAYVMNSCGLETLNVTDPTHPVQQGYAHTESHGLGVQVVGNTAYVVGEYLGLQGNLSLIDVRDPALAQMVSSLNLSRSAHDVDVVGNCAYVAADSAGLQVVDVSEPSHPVNVGGLASADRAYGVQVVGNLAYVANGNRGLQVYRVGFGYTNPVNFSPPAQVPRLQKFLKLPPTTSAGLPVTFTVVDGPARVEAGQLTFTGNGPVQLRAEQAGDQFYLPFAQEWTFEIIQLTQYLDWSAATDSGVLALDTPLVPEVKNSSGLPVSFRVESGPATIVNGSVVVTGFGKVVLTAEQPGDENYYAVRLTRTFNQPTVIFSPLGVFRTNAVALDVEVVGTNAYVAAAGAGLQVIDISNPALPVYRGGFDTIGSANGVQVVANLAYVADRSGGLQIIDISNPAKPVRVGSTTSAGPLLAVHVVGSLAYGAGSTAGLRILDVSNPAKPVFAGALDTCGTATGVQVVGSVAYVADGTAGLQIMDVSNPAKPVRTGGYNTPGTANAVQVVGSLAYVADGTSVHAINVGNPASPQYVGRSIGPAINNVQVVGGFAYLADGRALRAVDVGNPASMGYAGGFETGGNAWAVKVVGDLAYLANDTAGLRIFRIRQGQPQAVQQQSPVTVPFTGRPLTDPAIASSRLPLVFSAPSGPVRVVNNQIIFTGLGEAYVTATQAGDSSYLPVSTFLYFFVIPPDLTAHPAGNGLELTWPAGVPSLHLQVSETFLPDGPWQDVATPATEAAGEARVRLEATEAHRYFRLAQP